MPLPEDDREARARKLVTDLIETEGVEEAAHMERFISAVYRITEEEHAEGARWLRAQREGLDPGPRPAALTKATGLPVLDDHFWDCVEEYSMTVKESRYEFVRRICAAVSRKAQRGASGE